MIVNIEAGQKIPIATCKERLPLLFVCSHERSGTHFLMNTVSANTNYTAAPFINFDSVTLSNLVNFYSSQSVLEFAASLHQLENRVEHEYVSSIVKSHHSAKTLEQCFGDSRFLFLYIHRDPTETLYSFWKFLHRWEWHEGPKTAHFLEFVLSAPEGQLMRYQTHSHDTMISRWAAHVEGWIKSSRRYENVVALSYKDLLYNPEATLVKISAGTGINVNSTFNTAPKDAYIFGADITATNDELVEVREVIRSRLSKYPEAKKLFGN